MAMDNFQDDDLDKEMDQAGSLAEDSNGVMAMDNPQGNDLNNVMDHSGSLKEDSI